MVESLNDDCITAKQSNDTATKLQLFEPLKTRRKQEQTEGWKRNGIINL